MTSLFIFLSDLLYERLPLEILLRIASFVPSCSRCARTSIDSLPVAVCECCGDHFCRVCVDLYCTCCVCDAIALVSPQIEGNLPDWHAQKEYIKSLFEPIEISDSQSHNITQAARCLKGDESQSESSVQHSPVVGNTRMGAKHVHKDRTNQNGKVVTPTYISVSCSEFLKSPGWHLCLRCGDGVCPDCNHFKSYLAALCPSCYQVLEAGGLL
ncbi:hypothetical protein SARC_03881 [Sphaeroforma arctica JP610]|uniref:Uncharacterized protein n=1 Tax=Sphaeroforma arctica JP610 TaxID=667725 RepID=A0A0L0G6M9_9EUKA|nr:hypothetical protein SARC_03881 [Sphaeroforma arctica JP610]KNC83893.1 hypothetical protein SARC_03881 [Sphaeroforma arctica JP610]|eukprot:XP_014157795.1 hypothetical protein SARC_03881 [Sphaeroforma arctica JP610]